MPHAEMPALDIGRSQLLHRDVADRREQLGAGSVPLDGDSRDPPRDGPRREALLDQLGDGKLARLDRLAAVGCHHQLAQARLCYPLARGANRRGARAAVLLPAQLE
jgi:hypothetical protein